MMGATINGDLFLKDVDAPDDFMAARPHADGSIEILVYDTVNEGPYKFTSISKTDAIALAHKLMGWANA